jgi:hypothetical protein
MLAQKYRCNPERLGAFLGYVGAKAYPDEANSTPAQNKLPDGEGD